MVKKFQPLEPTSRSKMVAERIIQMIEAGDLKAGDKLPPEPIFAQQLGSSRGALREGLAHLKAHGIISQKPKEGTYILGLGNDAELIVSRIMESIQTASYLNILEMRDAIEQKAVRLVVQKATDEEIGELRSIAMNTAELRSSARLDYYFHYRMVELSGNTIFMSIIDSYYDDIRIIRERNLDDNARIERMRDEHLRIVDAIEKRDSSAAVIAVQNHMQQVAKQFEMNDYAGRR